MAFLHYALRGGREPKPPDESEVEFAVAFSFLDGGEEHVQIPKNYTFRLLAGAIGPSNLVLFRFSDEQYEEIPGKWNVWDTLEQWKREGGMDPLIVVPIYHNSTPVKRDVLSARYIYRQFHMVLRIVRPDLVTVGVRLNWNTTADELARHLCVTKCVGLFSAVNETDTNRLVDYELLPRNCNIFEWATGKEKERRIILPLVEFGGFHDDDGEPSNMAYDPKAEEAHASEDEPDDETAAACGTPDAGEAPLSQPTQKGPECKASGEPDAYPFEYLALKEQAEIEATAPEDLAGATTDVVVPIYKLAGPPSVVAALAERLLSSIQLHTLFVAWTEPGLTLAEKLQACMRVLIQIAGKEGQLRLQNITEESMYAALLCETAADRDLLQLDVPLLACTAVCGVPGEELVQIITQSADRNRVRLPALRKELKAGERGNSSIANKEARVLYPYFQSVQLVLSVPDQPETASLRENAPVYAPLATMLLADRVVAVGEVRNPHSGGFRMKGLAIESESAARIVLAMQNSYYRTRRWITPPSTNAFELVRYIALAVMYTGEQLREMLLEMDRANGGAVSAHHDALREFVQRQMEAYSERMAEDNAVSERELHEENLRRGLVL
jgi:hypothetical protein